MKEKLFVNMKDLIGNAVLTCLALTCGFMLCAGWDWQTFIMTIMFFAGMIGLSFWASKKLGGNLTRMIFVRVGFGFLAFLCLFCVLAKFAMAAASKEEEGKAIKAASVGARKQALDSANRSIANAKQSEGFGAGAGMLWESLLARVAE